MIDAKQAVHLAREIAIDMLSQLPNNLEEIEREKYQGREIWNITLSFPKKPEELAPLSAFASLGRPPDMNYKRVLVDAETGEFVAIKMREPASR